MAQGKAPVTPESDSAASINILGTGEAQAPDAPEAATPVATQTGRLLVGTTIGDKHYPPNSVLTVHAAHADSLIAQGAFDTSPEAVAYATGELGNEPVDLTA